MLFLFLVPVSVIYGECMGTKKKKKKVKKHFSKFKIPHFLQRICLQMWFHWLIMSINTRNSPTLKSWIFKPQSSERVKNNFKFQSAFLLFPLKKYWRFCCPQHQPTNFFLTSFLLPRSSLTEDKDWRMEKSSISYSQKSFERSSPSLLSLAIAFRKSVCIPHWQLKAQAWKYPICGDQKGKPLTPLREPVGPKLEKGR